MPGKPTEERLVRIETTQAALRACIKRARELVDDSERLIRRHKKAAIVPEPQPEDTAR